MVKHHKSEIKFGYMEGRKEGNALFNDALNTFIYDYMERRKEMF